MNENLAVSNRPKIGFALSGSGSRLVFYIGFLEKLKEENIPIDYIAACSSATLVATAFAAGTMDALKNYILSMNSKKLKGLLVDGEKGLFKLDKIEEQLRVFSKNLAFKDVKPLMGFVAASLDDGQEVVISMGDMARAAAVSCIIPGAVEAVKWGGKTLVDGGLLSIIPTDVVRDAGMDIVIGINLRGTKHIFSSKQIAAKRVYNFVKKMLLINYLEKVWDGFLPEDEYFDFDDEPGMMEVLSKSLDLAIQANKMDYSKKLACDLMISPEIPKFGLVKFFTSGNFQEVVKLHYEIGRKTAEDNIPFIKNLIKMREQNFEVKEPLAI